MKPGIASDILKRVSAILRMIGSFALWDVILAVLLRRRGLDWNDEGLRILKEVTLRFDALGIPYVLGGSIASGVQGMPRLTQDADISVEPFPGKEHELARGFAADYYVSLPADKEAVRDQSCFNIIHTPSAFKVDVFVRKDRPFELSAMNRRKLVEFAQRGVGALYVLARRILSSTSSSGIALDKKFSDRQWSDILSVIQVQGEQLDRAYLEHWAEDLGVADLLPRAFAQA